MVRARGEMLLVSGVIRNAFIISALLASAVVAEEPAAVPSARRPPAVNVKPAAAKADPEPASPPLPEGVSELRLDELLKPEIGDRGLEFSEKTLSLKGRRVRVAGWMVEAIHQNRRMFVLSPVQLRFHECEYGLADDLPAAVLHVVVPGRPSERVPYQPGRLLLTGTLELGPREEMDGRVTWARLRLDAAPTAAPAPATASR